MQTLTVVSVLFLLSLTGAVILFKFFKSFAIIKGEKYQAGGAIAGFIILYSVLYGSWYNIEKNKYQDISTQNKELTARLEPLRIAGTVDPYMDNLKIVLAVRETDPVPSGQQGKFRLKAPCVNPEEDDIRLYVITEDGYIPVDIYPDDEITNINIPISSLSKK